MKMRIAWVEAVLPLGIIAVFLNIAGNVQGFVHKSVHGRPKHIGNDAFDQLMDKRDKKVIEILSPSAPA